MKIGIIGCGVVGRALRSFYETTHEVYTYDVAWDAPEYMGRLDAECEVVFVAVGTPSAKDGSLDCSSVYDAVSKLSGAKTVILKSTVMPGTTDNLQAKYPEHTFWFVPEFLSEATAAEDYANPRRPHVVGYTDLSDDGFPPASSAVTALLPQTPGVKQIPARQAELLKLATNTFYALKVTYANMLYDIGMTQDTLYALGADNWIGGEHFQIDHKNHRGYSGACLPKDSDALFTLGPTQTLGIADLIGVIGTYNNRLKEKNG